MFSVEPQTNMLVITRFPEALKTITISVISCLGRVMLPPQYKIFLDPLSVLRPSSANSQVGQSGPSFPRTPLLSLFPNPQSPSMKIVTWNVRGAGNARFHLNVQDLINANSPEILVILEPKISGNQAEHVVGQVGLPRHFRVDPIGLSGGLWVLWDDRQCDVDVVRATDQSVAMLIRFLPVGPGVLGLTKTGIGVAILENV
nr:hypothetical protein CFP56_40202 [Quercus suber]